MRTAKTAKEALVIFARLASQAYEGNEYYLRSTGETTWLCFRDKDHESPGFVYSHHVTMMVYRRMVSILADGSWRPQALRFHGTELGLHENAEGFEDCTASFHAEESAIAVPTELLSRPLLDGENAEIDGHASDLSKLETDQRDTFVDSLHELIAIRFLYNQVANT